MRETQAVRITQEDMIANIGLLSMAKLLGATLPEHIQASINTVQDAMLFYDELYFLGPTKASVHRFLKTQWYSGLEKSSYAWDAVMKSRLLKETAMGFIQPYFQKTDVPTIIVFNTLNWNRNGLVRVFIDHEIIPMGKNFRIIDKDNHEIKAQFIKTRVVELIGIYL